MENSTIILITWSVTISLLYVGRLIKNNRLFKDINHQRALVSVLRYRLKDKPNNSKEFTLKELKEINVWSGKAVNNVYKESIPKDYPEYAKQVREANISVMSPIVDNTTEPPKGTLPDFEYDVEPPKTENHKTIINQLESAITELRELTPERDLLNDYISYALKLVKETAFPNVSAWISYDIKYNYLILPNTVNTLFVERMVKYIGRHGTDQDGHTIIILLGIMQKLNFQKSLIANVSTIINLMIVHI